jgi:hypothetical protein
MVTVLARTKLTRAQSEMKAVHNNKVMGQDLLKKVLVDHKKILM